ncbi:MAG: DUF805 domain-containing protein [Henriciella sp.]
MSNPLRAFKHCLSNLINFSDRDRRVVFWPYVGFIVATLMLVTMVAIIAIMGPAMVLAANTTADVVDFPVDELVLFLRLYFLIVLVIIFLLAAAVARRLHDAGMTAYFGLLPLPNLIFGLYYLPKVISEVLESGPTNGASFETLFINNMIYLTLVTILIVLLAQPSSKNDNKYGHAPQED